MKKIFTILLIFISTGAFCQSSGVSISPTGGSPDPSAALDVNFNNKGFLMPRLTSSQRDAIANPQPGLEIFNVVSGCLNIYTGSNNGWIEICSNLGCNSVGGTATASRSAVSCNDTVTLSLTGYNGQIVWYSSPDNGNNNDWAAIDGGPDAPVFVTPVTYANTYFQAQVSDNNNNSYCGSQSSSTVEVTVSGGSGLVGGTASSNVTQLTSCSPTPITLSLTGNSNGIIQWQSSYDGINFSNISGANTNPYNLSVSTPLYFQAVISDLCSDPPGYSSIVSITSTASCSTVAFTAVGTTSWQAPAGVTSVSYLVVAGGGGGGGKRGGGGGGGGFQTGTLSVTPGNTYTVTVGAGGAGDPGDQNPGSSGSNSVFASITSIGGGGGGCEDGGVPDGLSGGSGGGASASDYSSEGFGGPATGGQGYAGGNSAYGFGGGGGGGAGGVGQDLQCCGSGNNNTLGNGGNGGAGASSSISGILVTYAGGGGGGETNCCFPGGVPGTGGGTGGGSSNGGNGNNATDNTGGGGGGAGDNPSYSGGNGGSGIVILSW